MAFYVVDETTSKEGVMWCTIKDGDHYRRTVSTKTLALTTWKCYHCKAYVTALRGSAPPIKCVMCGRR
jgi:hypothetical protein